MKESWQIEWSKQLTFFLGVLHLEVVEVDQLLEETKWPIRSTSGIGCTPKLLSGSTYSLLNSLLLLVLELEYVALGERLVRLSALARHRDPSIFIRLIGLVFLFLISLQK